MQVVHVFSSVGAICTWNMRRRLKSQKRHQNPFF